VLRIICRKLAENTNGRFYLTFTLRFLFCFALARFPIPEMPFSLFYFPNFNFGGIRFRLSSTTKEQQESESGYQIFLRKASKLTLN